MPAPFLQPGTTYEDGNVLFGWSEPVTAVADSTAALTIDIVNRGVSLNFDNDDAAVEFDGTAMTVTLPQAVYIGDVVTATIGAGFAENGASEPNALIESDSVLNRSVIAYPTRTVNFTATIGGTVTLTSPDGSVDLTVKSASVDLKA